jgi:glycosyltransferase involved in cell wall biosynthesis
LGIPTVTTVHGFTGGGWKNRLYERLQRRAYRKFDAVVAVSRPLAEQLIGDDVPPQRLHCVPNAWPETAPPLDRLAARRALDLREDGFLIGWVGRLSHEKGPDLLLDALVHLTDLPVNVSVMGSGREQRSLAARARRLGVARLVHWHGAVPDAARYFAAFDVFALSSRTEGTPIVLFEAMAAGVPIVATQVGGVPDVVLPVEAALVAPDDPFALAVAIRAAYCNPTAARERAERARTRLRRDFAMPPWLERYAAIYRLVSRPAAPASAAVVAVEP